MENIHQILEALKEPTKRDILVTIICVKGSAYRKEGTSMLLQEGGKQIGIISGGCLEQDLQSRAEGLMKGQSQCIPYDMKSEDDFSWGQGAGCNGVIHVLLEEIDERLRTHLLTLKKCLEEGLTVTIIKKLTADFSVSQYLFLVDNHDVFGEWDHIVSQPILEKIKQEKNGVVFIEEWNSYSYVHRFHPKPRLFIFGAGLDSVPLADFASKAGFAVVVSDWRSGLCNRENFPTADKLMIGFPHEVIPQLMLHSSDFVVVMTHHFQRDKELLPMLLDKNLHYIGVMGSKERTSRLLDGKEIPPSIFTPVGMSIQAEGPEEIAISILAELICLKKKTVKGRNPLHGIG